MPHLNPNLFEAIERSLGPVEVVNDGEEFEQEVMPTIVYRNGRSSLNYGVREYGETYRTNCPFCGDRRQRLWIPYMWAEENEFTGGDNLHLAKCFNEDCLRDPDNRETLRHIVWPIGRPDPDTRARTQPPLSHESQVLKPSRDMSMPSPLTRIDQLPPGHPAANYLTERGFDRTELWDRWRVAYCENSPVSRPPISRRIVYPIHAARRVTTAEGSPTFRPEFAGWQSRIIGAISPTKKPKYLSSTGMTKSRLLYGLPRALCRNGPVVIVEGPTDVWRLGANAVALLGKDASPDQLKLLGSWFSCRPLVVFLDRDAGSHATKLRRALLSSRASMKNHDPVVIAVPPDARDDVGDCSRTEAWDAVALALVRNQAACCSIRSSRSQP